MKNKKEKILFALTTLLIAAIVTLSVVHWSTIVYLFHEMIYGVAIVKEYVESLGVGGILAISLVIIACFFVPVISSVPVQLASVITYGLFFGVVHVILSVFIASQLVFLFTRCIHIFQSPKRRAKRQEMEEKIRNSKRSITQFVILSYAAPFIPFLLIHVVAAVSGMKWWKYSLITFLGPLADILMTLWIGQKVTSASSPVTSFVVLMILITCVSLSLIFKNKIIDAIFTPKKKEKISHGE